MAASKSYRGFGGSVSVAPRDQLFPIRFLHHVDFVPTEFSLYRERSPNPYSAFSPTGAGLEGYCSPGFGPGRGVFVCATDTMGAQYQAYLVSVSERPETPSLRSVSKVRSAGEVQVRRGLLIDPRWLTSTVVDVATVICRDEAVDKMPILHDALMDAGCDNEEILEHCRVPCEHYRNCWVLGLLLPATVRIELVTGVWKSLRLKALDLGVPPRILGAEPDAANYSSALARQWPG